MRKRVVYVDDEPFNLKALKRLFRDEPFHFITFDSPKAALHKIKEIKPAVVISDQRMPEMTGIHFLEEIKKRQPDTVRIILTGQADLEIAISAINQGNVFRFFQKPWDESELKAEIAAALEYHQIISGMRAIAEKGVDEAAIKKERMKGVRELAITVRHELGPSMTIISGYSQLLQGYLDQDAIFYTYLSNIVSQIRKMEEIIAGITSIAKDETTRYLGNERMLDMDKPSSANRR